MMLHCHIRLTLTAAAALAAAPLAFADVQIDLYEDRGEWESALGTDYTTIRFDEFPAPTPIVGDIYGHLGITFSGFQFTKGPFPELFLNDAFGLDSYNTTVRFEFDVPRTSLAVDCPGGFAVFLYRDGEYLWHSSTEWTNSGVGNFEALVSSEPFDEVRFSNSVFSIDDLHFGPPIPAPAALPLLALGLLAGTSRRRSA